MSVIAWHTQTRPRLELKTCPWLCPVTLSLPMYSHFLLQPPPLLHVEDTLSQKEAVVECTKIFKRIRLPQRLQCVSCLF